jgi:hypothetical protein
MEDRIMMIMMTNMKMRKKKEGEKEIITTRI